MRDYKYKYQVAVCFVEKDKIQSSSPFLVFFVSLVVTVFQMLSLALLIIRSFSWIIIFSDDKIQLVKSDDWF